MTDTKKSRKSASKWEQTSERALLDIWNEKMGELRVCRKNSHILREMVTELENQGYKYTVLELKTKMHNMTARYRKEKKSGLPSEWDLYKDMELLLASYHTDYPQYQLSDSKELSGGEEKCKTQEKRMCNKKWQQNEERSLVDFLKRNPNFEKPTAQIYYRKFIDETQIDINWPLIRAKVLNMITCYNRTREWSESPDASSNLNASETMQDILQKIFKYYDDFHEVFSSNGDASEDDYTFELDFIKEENLSEDYQTSYTTDEILPENENEDTTAFIVEESNEQTMVANEPITDFVGDNKLNKGHQYSFPRSVHNHLVGQHKRRKLDKDNLPFSLKLEDIKFRRDKLQFERERFHKEMELKQKEIESQEKIKILEMEMRERIAMTEIKMKEKVALQALEKKWE